MPTPPIQTPIHPFLAGGGDMARHIAAFDWQQAGLPALHHWPAHMQTATALMLRCGLPMVMLWGADGVMVYNDAYAAFAGSRHPSVLGSPVRTGWPEAADFNDHVMTEGLAGASLSYKDLQITLHRNGSADQVFLNLDYSPLLDADGAPAGVMAIVVESTAQVLAERRLGNERERLARLFEQSPGFMAMLDGPSHVFSLVNPNYLKLVDYRPVLGRTVAEALPEAHAQGYVDMLDTVYQSGEAMVAHGSKFTMPGSDGQPERLRYVDFVYQPIRSSAGDVTGIFVEGIDVTDNTIAERRREELVRLSDVLRSLDCPANIAYEAARLLGETLQASRVGYGTIDAHTDMLFVERDWTAPGVQPTRSVVSLRDYGSFIDSLKRDESIVISDVRNDPRTASAADALELRHARSFVNLPLVERGELLAMLFVNDRHAREWTPEVLAFIREVGLRTHNAVARANGELELRASEARLREANENLEAKVAARTRELVDVEERFRQAQKMEAIGQLTGGIAHDFNNLLATMSNSLQILKRRLNNGLIDDADRYMNMAEGSIRRAASLTQRLLAFSRRQTLDPRPTNVNLLISELAELIRRTVGPAVQLDVTGQSDLWPTKIDPPQLESALLNLCINACDAMAPAGGSLAIAMANQVLDAVSAAERELPSGQYVVVSVTDTGCGMPPNVIARAFDPFFTTKPIGAGTGLGLSMVYGFVRQSGGHVGVQSAPGVGTTMTLYLPRHLGDMPGAVDSKPANLEHSRSGERILVVEDEAALRELFAEQLSEMGYETIAVENGAAAVAILQSDRQIDLLITDVGLPGGLNGRQVADAGQANRPDLKVLFVTGYAQTAAVGDSLLGRGMQVLTKPFDIDDLARKVRKMIEG
ncbi:MAG: ATP-binding protein [Burkholderiaceae bacterium]